MVCSAEFLVACLRICKGFKGGSFSLWEHFGQTDKIALITRLKKLNVASAFRKIQSREARLKKSSFQYGMKLSIENEIFIPGSLSGRRKTGPRGIEIFNREWNFRQTENENFKREWSYLRAWGNILFIWSSEMILFFVVFDPRGVPSGEEQREEGYVCIFTGLAEHWQGTVLHASLAMTSDNQWFWSCVSSENEVFRSPVLPQTCHRLTEVEVYKACFAAALR